MTTGPLLGRHVIHEGPLKQRYHKVHQTLTASLIFSIAKMVFLSKWEKLLAFPTIPHESGIPTTLFPIHLEGRQVEGVSAVLDTEDAKQEAVHAEQDTGPQENGE